MVLLLVVGVAACVVAMPVAGRIAPRRGVLFHGQVVPTLYSASGAAFAILLAFVVVLSFNGYARARDGASTEAVAVSQLYRVSKLMPEDIGDDLRQALACYARAVIHDEWPAMA